MSTVNPLLAYPPGENDSWPNASIIDGFLSKLLKDQRDLPAARSMARLAFFTPLFAAALYVPGWRTWWSLALYYVLVLGNIDRFILGMHVHLHRPWFKNRMLNKVWSNALGLFYGQTIWTYWSHHLAMHHPEDNGMEDLSSTQPYQRDSGWGLLRYMTIFVIIGIPQLILYFYAKGRKTLGRNVIIGEVSSWMILGVFAYFDWRTTFFVFVIPIMAARFLMMLGNWGQHSFVDLEGDEKYVLGTTLLETRHNRRCFNNGYHAMHHAHQAKHWSELPDSFEELRAEYGAADAPVFSGVPTFQAITLALVFGRYKWLEERLVTFEGDTRTSEERIAMLKHRVRAIPRTPAVDAANAADLAAAAE